MGRSQPQASDDWRDGRCGKCGHNWFRRYGQMWLCARCEWQGPPPKHETIEELKARVLAWIDAQIEVRQGNGSYARGQRSLLEQFRRQVSLEDQPR